MTMADKRTAAFENIFGRPSTTYASASASSPEAGPRPKSAASPPAPSARTRATGFTQHPPLSSINTSLTASSAAAPPQQHVRHVTSPSAAQQQWPSSLEAPEAPASGYPDEDSSGHSMHSSRPYMLYSPPNGPAAAINNSVSGGPAWFPSSDTLPSPFHLMEHSEAAAIPDGISATPALASASAPSRPHVGHHSRSSSSATTNTIFPPSQSHEAISSNGLYPASLASSRSSSFAWPNMYPGAPMSAIAAAVAGGTPLDQHPSPMLLTSWDQQQPPQQQQSVPPAAHHHHLTHGSFSSTQRSSRRASDASSMLDSAPTPLSSTATNLLRSYDQEVSPFHSPSSSSHLPLLSRHGSAANNSAAGNTTPGLPPLSTMGNGPTIHTTGLRPLASHTFSPSPAPMSPDSSEPGPGAASAGPAGASANLNSSPSQHHKSLPSALQHHWDQITSRRRRSAAASISSNAASSALGLTLTPGSPTVSSGSTLNHSPRAPSAPLPPPPYTFPNPLGGTRGSTAANIPCKDRVSGVKGPQPYHQLPSELSSTAAAPIASSNFVPIPGGGEGTIYPALLSQVARAFRERVPVPERSKNGLQYKDAFEGRAAVDVLCLIIRTSDRNLALLVGRALDAQKFFHDVTYDHRLRDSTSELYQFRVRLPPADPGPHLPTLTSPRVESKDGMLETTLHASLSQDPDQANLNLPAQRTSHIPDLPTGVFTLLTECYSPTCSPDRLCYSITCPRRLEQQAHMHGRLPRSSAPPPPARAALGLDLSGDKRGRRPSSFPPSSVPGSSSVPSSLPSTNAESATGPPLENGNLRMDATEDHQDSDEEDVPSGALWAESVPADVLASVPDKERKRQELINEVVVTERNFVRDMEYLRTEWIIPLLTRPDVIPAHRRQDFVTQLFWNITEILGVHQKFSEALVQRAKRAYVVDRIADLFTAWVPFFEHFAHYGAHQLYGKYEFEQEKSTNMIFARFVDETERRPAARKLELNGYLTKPVTRLSRYPLLLHQVLKYTPPDHIDAEELPHVIDMIKQLLSRVNAETGLSANRFNLAQLDQQLIFKPGEAVDLRLRDPMRELVFRGVLQRRAGVPSSDSSELQIFLFDHALVLTKPKMANKQELFKVTRRPIPLELLVVTVYDELPSTGKPNQTRVRTTTTRLSTGQRLESVMLTGAPKQDVKQGYALTLTYLGRKGYTQTLWASTYMARQKWFEQIEHRQDILRARSAIFNVVLLHAPLAPPASTSQALGSPGQLASSNLPSSISSAHPESAARISTYPTVTPLRVTCAVPFDFGRRIILGAQDGVYLSEFRPGARPPSKVLPLAHVTQVDVLEEFQLLIVLADRTLYTFLLEGLDPHDPVASLKRGRRLQGLVTFFRAGICLGRTLVCVVKSSPLPSSTIRTLEPVEVGHQRSSFHSHPSRSSAARAEGTVASSGQHLSKSGSLRAKDRAGSQLHRFFPGGGAPLHSGSSNPGITSSFGNKHPEALRVFKEFYIPMESTSVHFLKTKLCIAATKGFEIVDLETLDTQALLDPADQSLDFVFRNAKESLKPIAIYRIHRDFLLCYDEFAFYVNKTGWRARGKWLIQWEGKPTAFALHYPYLLAFEPSFIEVRHVGSGALHQVITGTGIRCLFSDVPPPPPPAQQAALRALCAQYTSLQVQQQQQQQQQHLSSGLCSPPTQQVPPQALYSPGPTSFPAPYPAPGSDSGTHAYPTPGLPLGPTMASPTSTPPSARANAPLPPLPFGSSPSVSVTNPSTRSPPLPAVPLPTPIPINPMWESAHASRTPIVLGAGGSVFYVRRANTK